jgi:hypothetical protein
MYLYKNKIQGAKVAVFGSMDPYIETIALALGAASTTTFEYNALTFERDDMNVICCDEYREMLRSYQQHGASREFSCDSHIAIDSHSADGTECGRRRDDEEVNRFAASFDVVLSFSSFDHSGLGRYGDDIDPDGDRKAMSFARHVMKSNSNAIFLATVPIGEDIIVWNLHRRYGAVRLPLLLADFKEVRRRLGYKADDAIGSNWRQTYEPVFVLTRD